MIIMNQKKFNIKNTLKFADVYPELSIEWHPTLNETLTPHDVSPKARVRVWWKCANNHEWITRISNRSNGSNCQECIKLEKLSVKSLAYNYPDLVKEWHPTLNGKLTPNDVFPKSISKAWWICSKGHEWLTSISLRSLGENCPYCSNRKLTKEISFASQYPEISKEWNFEKNNGLSPSDVFGKSKKIVWWKCSNGHEWETAVYRRANGGLCPYCLGKRACHDNSLGYKFPELAKEWHPTLNGSLTPYNCTYGSKRKVWWLCKEDHTWQVSISTRSNNRNGCPFCSGRNVTREKSIETLFPDLCKEWHLIKNNDLEVAHIGPYSKKLIWWQCNKNHEWQASASSRTKGSGCPYCSRDTILSSRSIAIKNPELAKEWHPTKNGTLTPHDVTISANINAWWICSNNHEWETSIVKRYKKAGCPYCSEIKKIPTNTFAIEYPSIANEWHPTKNEGLIYLDHSVTSSRIVWWICQFGHEWRKSIKLRISGNNCPYCNSSRLGANNNLSILFPEVAIEWHEKNEGLSAFDVLPNSKRNVWWMCRNGHEWQDIISRRVSGISCPHCFRDATKHNMRNTMEEISINYNTINATSIPSPEEERSLKMLNSIISELDKTTPERCSIKDITEKLTKLRYDLVEDVVLHRKSRQSEANYKKTLVDSVKTITKLRFDIDSFQEIKRNNACLEKQIESMKIESKENDKKIIDLDKIINEKSIESKKHQNACLRYKAQILVANRQKELYILEISRLQKELGHKILPLYSNLNEHFSERLAIWKNEGYLILLPDDIKDVSMREKLIMEAMRMFGPREKTGSILTETKGVNICIKEPDTHYNIISIDCDKSTIKNPGNNNYITCLECGLQLESLDWHLKVSHAMDGNSYRRKHNLPHDFPLVAPTILNQNQ